MRKTHLDMHMSDLARVGYYLIVPGLIFTGLILSHRPDHRVRVCKGKEGVKIAKYVPGGRNRWSKNVVTLDGELIPYGIWASQCHAVYLPGGEE